MHGRHHMVMNKLLPLQSGTDIKSVTQVSLPSLIFKNKLLLPLEIVKYNRHQHLNKKIPEESW